MPQRDSSEEATPHDSGPADGYREPTDDDADGDVAATGKRDGRIEMDDAGELVGGSVETDPETDLKGYLIEVAEVAVADPAAAGEEIGTLLSILREHDGDHRDDASAILAFVGDARPEEFEVWTGDLRSLAESADAELAFVGLRSLAQLAAANPTAARGGLDAGVAALDSTDSRHRQAAISLVAEVGSDDPDAVRSADGGIAAAMRDDDPGIRVAGAIAAGRLLGGDPAAFPRTATTLLDALDDGSEHVREYAHVSLANFALEHPEGVPEKERAVRALADASDRELGLREGATDEALSALLEYVDIR